MRVLNLSLFAIIAFVAFSFTIVSSTTYKVDVSASTLKWTGKKVTGQHSGDVKISDGSLVVENNAVKSGHFDIDLTSITVTDIEDKATNEKLVNHLKADDFFGVTKHPKSTFVITKVLATGKDQYNVTGNLTIKGITHPIVFPATIKVESAKVTAKGTITVDRTKYDIKFKSTSFFENLGDKAIDDNFTLDVNLVAKK